MPERHPCAQHWAFPPSDRAPLPGGIARTNLRALEARPGRFEHHLMPVASIGPIQLEVATASEPLYFAHRNISDEYALPLPTGDAMSDAFPFRTFLSDLADASDIARMNHKVNQLVLHPYGWLHWPGRLRPPYAPFEFAPGMRRCGVSLVMCATEPTEPTERPLFISAGCESGPKRYTNASVPMMIADLGVESPRTVAVVGDCTLELVVAPASLEFPTGGYVVILAGSAPHFATDLLYLPPGATLDGAGVERALVLTSTSTNAAPPPPTWDQVPPPPFAVYENAEPATLPFELGDLTVTDSASGNVSVRIANSGPAEIPRYWLARFLFRTALHQFRMGYLETYGGFYYDDTGDEIQLGLRDAGEITITRAEASDTIERLYRAVAPEGYVEHLV